MHRQWAVLDRSAYETHSGGACTRVNYWADFPPVLNDTMNEQVELLTAELSGRPVPVDSEVNVKYNWPSYEYSPETNNMQPCLIECVVDLIKMTQTNMQTGKVRAVRFYYVPS